jgi:hypothetical protein
MPGENRGSRAGRVCELPRRALPNTGARGPGLILAKAGLRATVRNDLIARNAYLSVFYGILPVLSSDDIM